MQPITRANAKSQGLKRYFTGTPCSKGHVAERRVSDHGCVECSRVNAASPKERERRREYMRDHQRRYRRKHPDRIKATEAKRDKAKTAADRRAARAKNPERDRAALRRSFQKHKAKRLAESRAWKEANREQWRAMQKAYKANRRALEAEAGGRIKKSEVLQLFTRQNGKCAAIDCQCDIANGFHLDHIIPLSRGGSNGIENAQLLCGPCNLSKNNKTMEEWMAWKQELSLTPPLLAMALTSSAMAAPSPMPESY